MRSAGYRPVQENVLRLEVSVGDVVGVKVGEGRHDLRGVELHRGRGEPAHAVLSAADIGAHEVTLPPVVHPHEGEQLAPAVEREEEVKVVVVLPHVGEADQEWVLDFLQHNHGESETEENKLDTTNRCEALKYYTFLKYLKYEDVSLSNTSLSNIQKSYLYKHDYYIFALILISALYI